MSHGRSKTPKPEGARHAGPRGRRGLTLGQQVALVGLAGLLVVALMVPGLLVLM